VNYNQKLALAAGLALLAFVVLYSPWQGQHDVRRGFLFDPPYARRIVTSQLLIEAGAVIVLTGGMILLLKGKPSGE
jgi:hypothetical protein